VTEINNIYIVIVPSLGCATFDRFRSFETKRFGTGATYGQPNQPDKPGAAFPKVHLPAAAARVNNLVR